MPSQREFPDCAKVVNKAVRPVVQRVAVSIIDNVSSLRPGKSKVHFALQSWKAACWSVDNFYSGSVSLCCQNPSFGQMPWKLGSISVIQENLFPHWHSPYPYPFPFSSSRRFSSYAALINAKCVNACGKLPRCSPDGLNSSAKSPK
jgi:hypothetical protein